MIHHPITKIMNDKTIIDIAINLKYFLKESIQLINLVRMRLNIIFILDLLKYNTNRVKECFQKRRDRFTCSTFK